jgi:hypothetical protein
VCCALVAPASAEVIHTVTEVSVAGNAPGLAGHFHADGDAPIHEFCNASTVACSGLDDLLCSYCLDVVNGSGRRPTPTCTGAPEQAWMTGCWPPDEARDASAELRAVDPEPDAWPFRLLADADMPRVGFRVGTVTQSALDAGGFDCDIVGAFVYGLYAGDASTGELGGYVLAEPRVELTFPDMPGFAGADIADVHGLRLGVGPGSALCLPEPMTGFSVSLGTVALRRWR